MPLTCCLCGAMAVCLRRERRVFAVFLCLWRAVRARVSWRDGELRQVLGIFQDVFHIPVFVSFSLTLTLGVRSKASAFGQSRHCCRHQAMVAPSSNCWYVAKALAISLMPMNSSALCERADEPGPSFSDGHGIRAWSLSVGEP